MTEPLPKVPVETIIEKIDKPKSSGVAIKIMVGLLILVILSEVGYLIYNNYLKPSTSSLSGPNIEETTAPNSDTTPLDQNQDQSINQNKPAPSINNISRETIGVFSDFLTNKEIVYKSGSVSFSLEAQILKISTNIENINGTNYPLMLTLKHENTSLPIYFSQKEYISAKVTDPYNPEKVLDLSNLKVGDKISLGVNAALINNPNSDAKIFINILE